MMNDILRTGVAQGISLVLPSKQAKLNAEDNVVIEGMHGPHTNPNTTQVDGVMCCNRIARAPAKSIKS